MKKPSKNKQPKTKKGGKIVSGKERETKIKLNRPTNLPTVEQALRDTVEVMDALIQPDLTKPEGKKLLKKPKPATSTVESLVNT